jgi:hypothetical protein
MPFTPPLPDEIEDVQSFVPPGPDEVETPAPRFDLGSVMNQGPSSIIPIPKPSDPMGTLRAPSRFEAITSDIRRLPLVKTLIGDPDVDSGDMVQRKGILGTAGSIPGQFGRTATAIVGDTAQVIAGEKPSNLASVRGDEPLPIRKTLETAREVDKERGDFGWGTVAGDISLGIADMAPKITLMPAGGLPTSMAGSAALFGYDEQGNFHPKSAAFAALFPVVGKAASAGADKMIQAGIDRGAGWMGSAAAQKAIHIASNQASMDALMVAQSTPELVELAKTDPQEFKRQLAVIIGSNLAFAIPEVQKRFEPITLSAEAARADNAARQAADPMGRKPAALSSEPFTPPKPGEIEQQPPGGGVLPPSRPATASEAQIRPDTGTLGTTLQKPVTLPSEPITAKTAEVPAETVPPSAPSAAPAGQAAPSPAATKADLAALATFIEKGGANPFAPKPAEPISPPAAPRPADKPVAVAKPVAVDMAETGPTVGTPNKPSPTAPDLAGAAGKVKSPLPDGQHEISRDQAIAIHGGRKNLLPKPGETKAQLQDPTGKFLIGQTADGRFFTQEKSDRPTDAAYARAKAATAATAGPDQAVVNTPLRKRGITDKEIAQGKRDELQRRADIVAQRQATEAAKVDKPTPFPPGAKVMVQIAPKSNKFHDATVTQVHTDGTVQVRITKTGESRNIKLANVTDRPAAAGKKTFEQEFAGLTTEQRTKAKADHASFIKVIKSQGPEHGWLRPEHTEPTDTKALGNQASDAMKSAIRRAWQEAGLEGNPESALDRSKNLAKLREYVIKNRGRVLQEHEFKQYTSEEHGGPLSQKANKLNVGDVIEVNGDPVEVIAKDAKTGDITLKDGRQFGVQEVDGGETLFVERVKRAESKIPEVEAKIPQLGAMEKGTGDLLKNQTEDFTLSGEKASDGDRIATEKAKAEADKAAGEAAAKKNQGEMFSEGNPNIDTGAAGKGGLGGAKPSEVEPAKPFTTKNTIEQINKERAERGVGPLEEHEVFSNKQAVAEATRILDETPDAAEKILARLRKKRETTLDPTERAIVAIHRAQLSNAYYRAIKNWREHFENGSAEAEAAESANVEFYSEQLSKLDELVGEGGSGTAAGRSLQAIKIGLREDYSLDMMTLKRMKAKGEKLTKEETLELLKAHERIAELEAKLEAAEKKYKADTREADSAAAVKEALDRVAKEAASQPQYHPSILDRAERIVKGFERRADVAVLRLREKLARTNTGGADPTIIFDLAEIGVAKLGRKIVDFAKWADAVRRHVGVEYADQIEPYLKPAYDKSQEMLESDLLKVKGVDSEKVKRVVKGAGKTRDLAAEQKDVTDYLKEHHKEEGDLTGANPSIRKLMELLVEHEGIKERLPMETRVHEILQKIDPTITREQAMDLMSGYGKSKLPSPEFTKRTVRDISAQIISVRKLLDYFKGESPKATGLLRDAPSDIQRGWIKMVNEAKKAFHLDVPTDPAKAIKSALDSINTRLTNRLRDLRQEVATRQRIISERSPSPYNAETLRLRNEIAEIQKAHDEIFGRELTDAQRLAAVEKSAERQIAEIERQMRSGEIFPRSRVPFAGESAKLTAARARIAELKEQRDYARDAAQPKPEPEAAAAESRVKTLDKQIEAIENQLRDDEVFSKPKKERTPSEDARVIEREKKLAELKEQRKNARERNQPSPEAHEKFLLNYLLRLRQRAAEYQERTAKGDFEKAPPKPKRELNEDVLKALADVQREKTAYDKANHEYELARRTKAQKVWSGIKQTGGAFVNIVSSYDLSSPRQMLAALLSASTRVLTNPKAGAELLYRPFVDMFKAASSEGRAEVIEQRRKMRPNSTSGADKKAGIEYTDLNETKFTKGEENAISILDEWAKLPFKTGNLGKSAVTAPFKLASRGVRASNRAFIASLNTMRAGFFDHLLDVNFRDRPPTDVELRVIGNMVNIATGRGKLNPAVSKAGSIVLWSPKLLASRVQFLTGQPIWGGGKLAGSARARKIVVKEYARIILGGVALALVSRLFDEKEKNVSTSTDFGKVVRGNTRIDPWGGFQQLIVFEERLQKGETTSIEDKNRNIAKAGSGEVIWNFFKNKARPDIAAAVRATIAAIDYGKDPKKVRVTPGEAASAALPVPLAISELVTTMRERGMTEGAIIQVLSEFGAGVSSYEAKEKQK